MQNASTGSVASTQEMTATEAANLFDYDVACFHVCRHLGLGTCLPRQVHSIIETCLHKLAASNLSL